MAVDVIKVLFSFIRDLKLQQPIVEAHQDALRLEYQ